MSSRNHDQWNATPDLQQGEWVDSKIYSDEEIFEDELKKIWSKTWIPVCHESELKEAYSFRTMTVAREPVIVVRGKDMVVRAFLNVCPHRGNMIERRPSGNYKRGTPSGTLRQ